MEYDTVSQICDDFGIEFNNQSIGGISRNLFEGFLKY